MPEILAVGTAVPQHQMHQSEAVRFAEDVFGSQNAFDVQRLIPVFRNTTIRRRHFCMTMDWLRGEHSFSEKNREYISSGVDLAEKAIRTACEEAGMDPAEIGHIFFISSTGISTPSLDAHLFNRLRFRPSILRTPIWGLGCAGGVAGMIRAADWVRAYPKETALVAVLELCGLTFLSNDLSKSNFVATSLFGDGCGAMLVAGDESGRRRAGLRVSLEASGSVTWPDSLDVMGWEVVDHGLKVLFSKNIPRIVQTSARPAIEEFLKRNGLALGSIDHCLSHPGGARVIEAYQEALRLEDYQVAAMSRVLSRYGNMSSATVFFVYRDFLDSMDGRSGHRILSTALGPGFSSEMLLARCL